MLSSPLLKRSGPGCGDCSSIRDLIEQLGGPSIVASRCRIGASAVSNWSARKAISGEHLLTVWAMAVEAGIDWAPPGTTGLMLVRLVAA